MEEKKVIVALINLGCSNRKAKKLIVITRKERIKAQKERNTVRANESIKNLLNNLY